MFAVRFYPVISAALCAGLSTASSAEQKAVTIPNIELAALGVPRDALKDQDKSDSGETTHIKLVLVGDTGYAPHGVRPNPKGVSKHGYWQSWDQTTRRIRNEINGDINFANIETVISANGRLRRWPKAFNFVMHPNGAQHLVDIGFNLFSMANNHSFDFGAGGIRDSLKYAERLKASGLLAHAGIGVNRKQAAHVPVFSSKDARFAFGAIGIGATYGGLPRASDKRPGQLGINNKSDVRLLMDNLKAAEADYRILSLHRGYERIIRVDGNEIRQIRKNMLDQGAVDLLIGHHAHVTRGVEINNGRLIFYGLGNFLHQGTANMAKHGRCKDYSIIARVHLVRKGQQKPQLAAVEIVPITETHRQVRPMRPRRAAKSVAILNGLARQFDNPGRGAKGVRFSIRGDGTGLYCTPAAAGNDATASLCLDYDGERASRPSVYRAALSTCGRSYAPQLIARRSKPKINKISKPSTRPETRLAALAPSAGLETVAPITVVPSLPVRKGKPIYDAGLLRPDFGAMTKKDIKAYWTRVWYARRGKKPPAELVQIAIRKKTVAPVSKVALLDAWKKLDFPKAKQPESGVKPKRKSDGKLVLAEAWAALGSKKFTEPEPAAEPKPQSGAKTELAAAWAALDTKKVVQPAVVAKLEPVADGKQKLAAAWSALRKKKAIKSIASVAPKPKHDGKVELASAWAALSAKKASNSVTKVVFKPKDDAKVALAAAWASLGSGKSTKPNVTQEVVAKLVEDPPKADVSVKPEKEQVQENEPKRKIIYDAGLERPVFKGMTKKDINAYWTRVWYARRDLRRKRREQRKAPTS